MAAWHTPIGGAEPDQQGRMAKLKEALDKLAPMFDKLSGVWGNRGDKGPVVQSPGQVGQQIGASQPAGLPIKYDPSGAAGQLNAPHAQPPRGVSQPAYGSEMMSTLDPHGSGPATFSAIQGVSQFLQEWRQRKDQKQQAEAANIAQALMSAIENKDEAMMSAILTNQKATKVLDKVYKGWLQKAESSGKPPDPGTQGFEQGLQQHVQEKQGGGQGGQQGGVPTPQAPKQMGGYLLPQAGPAQQLGAAKLSAETQAAQQDPARLLASQMSSGQMGQAERIANMLEVSPRELAALEASHQRAVVQGYYKLLTAAAQQDALTERTLKTQASATERTKMQVAGRKEVAEIQGRHRKAVAEIIHSGSKKGSSGDDVMFKILKEQIDSGTRLRNNAQSLYEKMVGKDSDAASALKKQADDLDQQISHWNEQLDTMKNRQIMQDMFMHLLSPDEGEDKEENKEEPPPN